MKCLLIGAGGHAKAIVEALNDRGSQIAGYVDPIASKWLGAPRLDEECGPSSISAVVLGIGGVDPDGLVQRYTLLQSYIQRGFSAITVIHPAAFVSASATICQGAVILAGAIVQPNAKIGAGCIVNSGAIVEHDSCVDIGSHVAPGAVVLGNCTVGCFTMIGAGAVILPGASVPDYSLVPAATRFPVPKEQETNEV
jgi:sugar O-acyltransferase (sialic acid O-acetyltransferase NeuD family)